MLVDRKARPVLLEAKIDDRLPLALKLKRASRKRSQHISVI